MTKPLLGQIVSDLTAISATLGGRSDDEGILSYPEDHFSLVILWKTFKTINSLNGYNGQIIITTK